MRIVRVISILLLAISLNNSKAQTVPSWKVTEVQKYIADDKDSVLVISFWATFCKPCLEELPYLQALSKKYKAKVLLVSLDLKDDYPNKIIQTSKDKNIYYPIVWLNETNADYFCPRVDKAWDGSLPATFFVNNKKGYKHFVNHQMTETEAEDELKKAL